MGKHTHTTFKDNKFEYLTQKIILFFLQLKEKLSFPFNLLGKNTHIYTF